MSNKLLNDLSEKWQVKNVDQEKRLRIVGNAAIIISILAVIISVISIIVK